MISAARLQTLDARSEDCLVVCRFQVNWKCRRERPISNLDHHGVTELLGHLQAMTLFRSTSSFASSSPPPPPPSRAPPSTHSSYAPAERSCLPDFCCIWWGFCWFNTKLVEPDSRLCAAAGARTRTSGASQLTAWFVLRVHVALFLCCVDHPCRPQLLSSWFQLTIQSGSADCRVRAESSGVPAIRRRPPPLHCPGWTCHCEKSRSFSADKCSHAWNAAVRAHARSYSLLLSQLHRGEAVQEDQVLEEGCSVGILSAIAGR